MTAFISTLVKNVTRKIHGVSKSVTGQIYKINFKKSILSTITLKSKAVELCATPMTTVLA